MMSLDEVCMHLNMASHCKANGTLHIVSPTTWTRLNAACEYYYNRGDLVCDEWGLRRAGKFGTSPDSKTIQ